MIDFKNLRKIISIIVIGSFIFQSPMLLQSQQEDDIRNILEEAKELYNDSDYKGSKEKLDEIIKLMEGFNSPWKYIWGECYLLLGAIYEKKGEKILAEENYLRAKKKYGVESIEGIDLESLTIYKKIVKEVKEGIIEKSGTKRKKKFPWLLVTGGVVVIIVAVIFLTQKKKYTLSVTRGEGVDGSPISGSFKYKKGESVNYSYSLRPGYNNLVVTLDGSPQSTSGIISMKGNHALSASATANVVSFVTDKDNIEIPEGGTASFNVSLSAQPQADVNVTASVASGDSDITVQSFSNPRFTTSDWNQPRTVTLAASEDSDLINGTASIRISANGIDDKTITVTEKDNDFLRFVTDTESVTVPEGRTNSFNVKLSSQPLSDIQATVTRVSGDSDITVKSGQNLTFTSSNWETFQTVTLRAANDSDTVNDQATIRISAPGVPYKDITAIEDDDDRGGCTISVSISSPANDSPVSGTETIRASVSGTCEIDRVEFFVDNILIHTDTTPPYTASWNTSKEWEGSHNVRVVAHSTTGKTASDAITVTVTR